VVTIGERAAGPGCAPPRPALLPSFSFCRVAQRAQPIVRQPASGRISHNGRPWRSTQDPTVRPMGDKSPKAKEKSKKQDAAGKSQKKAAAFAKAAPPPTSAARKK
jgi:hypothetical protein